MHSSTSLSGLVAVSKCSQDHCSKEMLERLQNSAACERVGATTTALRYQSCLPVGAMVLSTHSRLTLPIHNTQYADASHSCTRTHKDHLYIQRPSKLSTVSTLHLVTTQRTQVLRLTQTGTQFVCECSAAPSSSRSLCVSTLAEVHIGTRNACSNAGFSFLFAGLCF